MKSMRMSRNLSPPHLPDALPSAKESELAQRSSRLLAACIGHGEAARLRVIEGNETIDVPVSAMRMLVEILNQMAQGNAVSIVPIHAELTTQQAADFLNVSRPFVVNLIGQGHLSYRKVGTHRRVAFEELLRYRKQNQVERMSALDALTREAQELEMGYQ